MSSLRGVVQDIFKNTSKYGINSTYHNVLRLPNKESIPHKRNQTVIIDYSSVNIGKPVHAGHLRATLLGSFISRINKAFGHNVIGINYLGDWGTQFGLLAVAYERFGNENLLKSKPMEHLFDIYVKAHKEIVSSPEIKELVRKHVAKMENNDSESLSLWNQFRDVTLVDLKQTYERMDISFTSYEFESHYASHSSDIVNKLLEKNLLQQDSTGLRYFKFDDQKVAVLKSDGTSLYLTRDIAAALARQENYNFDRIHYVVDKAQEFHFKSLHYILNKLVPDKWNCPPWDFHVQLGRVANMSTRKGTSIFLKDILDAAKSEMEIRLKNKLSTRVKDKELEATAEILGQTLLVFELLGYTRTNTVNFQWNRDKSGLYSQYCHARLCSLEEKCRSTDGLIVPSNPEDIDKSHQLEGEGEDAHLLGDHLSKFHLAVHQAYVQYEPKYLVQYSRKLMNLINVCFNSMSILKCPNKAQAQSRLALFLASRQVLANAFHLIGIKPLRKI